MLTARTWAVSLRARRPLGHRLFLPSQHEGPVATTGPCPPAERQGQARGGAIDPPAGTVPMSPRPRPRLCSSRKARRRRRARWGQDAVITECRGLFPVNSPRHSGPSRWPRPLCPWQPAEGGSRAVGSRVDAWGRVGTRVGLRLRLRGSGSVEPSVPSTPAQARVLHGPLGKEADSAMVGPGRTHSSLHWTVTAGHAPGPARGSGVGWPPALGRVSPDACQPVSAPTPGLPRNPDIARGREMPLLHFSLLNPVARGTRHFSLEKAL